jgi:co-chaperonin GroES (HSP10)
MSRRRVRINPKFYLILTLFVGIIVTVLVLALQDSAGGTLKQGSMEAMITGKAVLIRDEMSISVDRYDRVEFSVGEGETVYEGMPIATVYKWGYTDDMAQTLLNTETEIYNAQKSQLSGVENAEFSSIELQIEQKRAAIRAAVSGTGEGDTLTLQNELKTLMEQRTTFLKNTVQPTEELTRLYNTREEKLSQLASYKTEITAAKDGRVSFYFDGFEQILNKDKLDTINAALVNTTVSGTVDSLGGSGDNLLYRIVNTRLWYAAFVTDGEEEAGLLEGQTYTVTFDGYEDQAFTATANELVHSEAGVLNMLEFTEDMGALLNSRVITLTANATLSGIVVPLDAIGNKDGASIITIENGDNDYDVQIDIIATNGENALIKARDGETTLSEGMRYKKQ